MISSAERDPNVRPCRIPLPDRLRAQGLCGIVSAHWPLIGVTLLAAALRLVIYCLEPFPQQPPFSSDAGTYFSFAEDLAAGRDWASGDEWHAARRLALPPLYPLFLSAFLRSFGQNMPLVFCAQILLSIAIPAIVYCIACRFAEKGTACLAALLVSLSPGLALVPSTISTEALYVPILAMACLCSVMAVQRASIALSGLAGVLCAAASLTRNVAMLLPLAVILCVVLVVPLKKSWKLSIAVLVGWLIVTWPWALFKAAIGRELRPYDSGQMLMGLTDYALMAQHGFMVRPKYVPWLYEDSEQAEARYLETVWKPLRTPGYVPPVTGRYFLSHPGDYLQQSFWRFYLLVRPEPTDEAFNIRIPSRELWREGRLGLLSFKAVLLAFDAVLLATAAGGLLIEIPRWKRYAPLYAMLGYFVSVHVLVYCTVARYRFPLIPLLAVFSALFLSRVWCRIGAPGVNRIEPRVAETQALIS